MEDRPLESYWRGQINKRQQNLRGRKVGLEVKPLMELWTVHRPLMFLHS